MVNDRGQHFHSRITPPIPAKPVKAHVNKLLDHTERNGFSQKEENAGDRTGIKTHANSKERISSIEITLPEPICNVPSS